MSIAIVIVLLISSQQVMLRPSFAASDTTQLVSVAILMGANPPSNSIGDRIQIQTMLENEGLIYRIVNETQFGTSLSQNYQAIIVIGSSQPDLNSAQQQSIQREVQSGTGLLWIGGNLPSSFYPLLGLANATSADLSDVSAIEYAGMVTGLFNETIYPVSLAEATGKAYFIDNSSKAILPAETSYRSNPTSGLAYYFAYDAYSWWDQDSVTPWLRAFALQSALQNILQGHITVRLAPYPNGLKSVFISRIEDVDPLHTGKDWLTRGYSYLNYYSQRDSSLSVALIPMYFDPTSGLTIGLGNNSATPLRNWLTSVVLNGGSIVQHGYTHQIGTAHTGASPEFYNPSTNTWLNESQQQEKILLGSQEIQKSLGIIVSGFIPPEYAADADTYAALHNLGFAYVDVNNNTPYFDPYGFDGLINIPETMGYIPLNAPNDTESIMKMNLEMLYNMSGVMLFFDHLYDNNSLRIGEDLLSQAMTLPLVWYPNTNTLAAFWMQRLQAYNGMSVNLNNGGVSVSLGRSYQPGLTLVVQGADGQMSVSVNGRPWSVTGNDDEIVLPNLPSAMNSIKISFLGWQFDSNVPYGITIGILAIASSVIVVQSLPKRLHGNE